MSGTICPMPSFTTEQEILCAMSGDLSSSFCQDGLSSTEVWRGYNPHSPAFKIGERVIRPFIDHAVCPAINMAGRYVVRPMIDRAICPVINLFKQIMRPNPLSSPTLSINQAVQEIPFETWPNKEQAIIQHFEMNSKASKQQFAQILCAATCDNKTREVGDCFLHALVADNLREKYRYLYRLIELLPTLTNHNHIEKIFDYAIPSFEAKFSEISFSSLLNRDLTPWNDMKVWVYGNLVMGMHNLIKDWKTLPSLLAFDKTTKRFAWGIPIKERPIYCEISSVGLAIVYPDDPNMHIYNPETGDKMWNVQLPSVPGRTYPRIYSNPSGFWYVAGKRNDKLMVDGGSIVNGKWKSAFSVEAPCYEVQPCGNYISSTWRGTLDPFPMVVISQNGSVKQLDDCVVDLIVKHGKLFTLEKVSGSTPSSYLIAMQSLEESATFQAKGDRSEYPIDNPYLRFHDVCDDGTVICEDYQFHKKLFIDVVHQQVVESSHKASSCLPMKFVAKTVHGVACYTYDQITRALWKQSES